MCGRFYISSSLQDIAAMYGVEFDPLVDFDPSFNIAPTQDVTIIRASRSGKPELARAQWGLIPSWAKDRSIQNSLINARSETAASKPAYREAFAKRRCVIPADGFYEWMPPKVKGARKQPFAICSVNANAEPEPIAMAGLWESWKDRDGSVVETCTVLTTEANKLLRPIHERMPVLLRKEDVPCWLGESDPESIQDLCKPFPPDRMAFHAVSRRVSNARNNDPTLPEPVEGTDGHVPDTLFG